MNFAEAEFHRTYSSTRTRSSVLFFSNTVCYNILEYCCGPPNVQRHLLSGKNASAAVRSRQTCQTGESPSLVDSCIGIIRSNQSSKKPLWVKTWGVLSEEQTRAKRHASSPADMHKTTRQKQTPAEETLVQRRLVLSHVMRQQRSCHFSRHEIFKMLRDNTLLRWFCKHQRHKLSSNKGALPIS